MVKHQKNPCKRRMGELVNSDMKLDSFHPAVQDSEDALAMSGFNKKSSTQLAKRGDRRIIGIYRLDIQETGHVNYANNCI